MDEEAPVRDRSRFAIVISVHPQCPCTRATVAELERILQGRADRADVHVLVVRPRGLADDPLRSWLWTRLSGIGGVNVQLDEQGELSTRFGAFTSGQVLVYDPSGTLRFAGGITASRGHEGNSAGRAAVEGLLDGRSANGTSSVFGCSLLGGSS